MALLLTCFHCIPGHPKRESKKLEEIKVRMQVMAYPFMYYLSCMSRVSLLNSMLVMHPIRQHVSLPYFTCSVYQQLPFRHHHLYHHQLSSKVGAICTRKQPGKKIINAKPCFSSVPNIHKSSFSFSKRLSLFYYLSTHLFLNLKICFKGS